MNHFLEISQLTQDQVFSLLDKAFAWKQGSQPFPDFSQHRLANLFYEHSTRTRTSFELAAHNLSIPVVNLDLANSSENKGEVIQDTLANLVAMGIDLLVMRHKQENLQQTLASSLGQGVHLINAGDGVHAHPSQAMLDLMTILEHKPDLSRIKVAITGNILHSRVANSLQCLFALMGLGELVLVAPKVWQPKTPHFGRVTDSLRDGLDGADVIICLRVQYERLLANESLDLATFRSNFALTRETLSHARPDAIVMHPGPVNRGVEMDSEIVDGPRSVILQQVKNGVFMRMAIIEALLSSK